MLLFLPPLPIKIDSLSLWLSAIFVAAWRTVRIEWFRLECGDRRRSRLLGGARRRLCDQYACWEFFVPRTPLLLRVAVKLLQKVSR